MGKARKVALERALAAWDAWHAAEPGIERYHAEKLARACQIRFDRLVALQEVWRAAVYRSHALRCDCSTCREDADAGAFRAAWLGRNAERG